MKTAIEYKDEILSTIENLISCRYFELDKEDEVMFEDIYHDRRRSEYCDFVVRIKGEGYYFVNIWASERLLNFVKEHIDNVEYVRKDGIGILEDTIVGNINEFLESLNTVSFDYHYMKAVDEREANITKEQLVHCLTN